MQLDGHHTPLRRTDKCQSQMQKSRDTLDRCKMTYRFEKMMNDRLKTVTNNLQNLELRIQTEVNQRVSSAVADFLESDALRNIIDERVAEIMGVSSSSSDISSTSDCSEPTSSSPALEDLETEEEEQEPSCSSAGNTVVMEPVVHYPNKWEFISVLNPGEITDFRLEQFTKPVREALNLSEDAELFPRMSLEEMIERDHPTTSESDLFDEKKITCKNRPHGKELTDEEFFCLAPCCSGSRLYQAASCPFLPSFVKKRMVFDCYNVLVQRRGNGIELITPIRWQIAKPIVPPGMEPGPSTMPDIPEPEEPEEEMEEDDPFTDRQIVEQFMHEYFIPTPAMPTDDIIFGPYLRKCRESDDVSAELLRSLVRRVNSNLDNSFKSHQELELFAELDQVPVDEKYGRLPFDPMIN